MLKFRKNTKNEKPLQQEKHDMRELTTDELDQVAGTGDPYTSGTGSAGNSVGTGGKTGKNGPIVLPELP